MRLRRLLFVLPALLLLPVVPAGAQTGPLPDPAFIEQVPGGECTADNEYEANLYDIEVGDKIYDEGCKRITFAFGPILVKPGQNDALIGPVTIEKPAYEGYLVRFKPDLLRAVDGQPPPTHELHVHHATWLHEYGDGPFAASGEEKTYRNYPKGYGLPVEPTDTWLLLYMLHTDIATPQVVWLTYQVDFVEKATAESVHDIVPVLPIWRDVMVPSSDNRIEGVVYRSGNPIFNVHRGFGGTDPDSGRKVCVWPKQNCARSDYYTEVNVHQGLPGPDEAQDSYDHIKGTDWTVPADLAGTLIYGGGHVHPGGTRVEISLVRDGVEKPIIISDAFYWDEDEPERVGGRPVSWNFSMGINSASLGWKVKIKEGDIIRINGVYDTEEGSWYGQMGILNLHVAVNDPHGPPGVDVFEDDVVLDRGVSSEALVPQGPYDPKTNWRPATCTPDLTGESGQKRLCLRGQPTHGHLPESGHFGGGCGADGSGCPPIVAPDGPMTTEIHTANFSYGNADLSVIPTLGIPRLKVNQPAKFFSYDTAARVWHSFTRCAYPCNGPSDMAYPIPDGGNGDPWDYMDFDSGELGYGTLLDQTKSQVGSSGSKTVTRQPAQWVSDGAVWEFTPTETGTFTFWCRIHRGMRGAFKVVE